MRPAGPPARPVPTGSAFPERRVEQLPGGHQVLQHALQAGAIERAAGRGSGLRKVLRDAVLVEFEKAEIDAVIAALVILVVTLEGSRRVAVLFRHRVFERFLDRAEGGGDRGVGKTLHRLDAVLLEDALHAANGVALAVQETADA